MNADLRKNRPDTWLAAIWALLLRIAVTVALVYVLYRVQFIIVVVLISVMLAFTMAPLVDALQRGAMLQRLPYHARRNVATTVVFVLLGLVLFEVAILIIRPITMEISGLAASWGDYQHQWAERMAWLQALYARLPPDVQAWIEEHGVGDFGTRVGEQLQHLANATMKSGMLIVELILVPVLAFSFLTESRPLKREFSVLLPRARLRDGLWVMRQTGHILQSYAIGQLILALIAGAVVWVMMVGLGIRYPFAMAIIAAVTRVIPVVGPILGAIPIVTLTALQRWDLGLTVLALFTLLHLVESKVVMPRVIGYRIKLHPAVVIVVLLIGAEFFGMWGMFLAAPVAAVAKVLFNYFFVRPRIGRMPSESAPQPPVTVEEGRIERPAVAGIRTHSGAH